MISQDGAHARIVISAFYARGFEIARGALLEFHEAGAGARLRACLMTVLLSLSLSLYTADLYSLAVRIKVFDSPGSSCARNLLLLSLSRDLSAAAKAGWKGDLGFAAERACPAYMAASPIRERGYRTFTYIYQCI